MKASKQLFTIMMALVMMLGMMIPSGASALMINDDNQSLATMDPLLVEEMEKNAGLINVIVTFHGDSAPTKSNMALLKGLGIEKGITLQSLPIAGVLATTKQIEALSKNSAVRSLYLNSEVTLHNEESTDLTGATKVKNDPNMRITNGGLPVSGKGIGVVVNDSGVDGTHPDLKYGKNLKENVMGTTNLNAVDTMLPITYVEGVINTDTNSGHGTHVAGTVGGSGAASGGKYQGVAPGADIIGYGSGGVLLILDTLGGFDYAITHQAQYNIRVITNSWGSAGGLEVDNPVYVAAKKCYDRGIVVLFSASNSGPGEDTHNKYAKAPWVISVAAGTKQGTLADFSSRGTKGVGGTFEYEGETWTWKDEPAITGPGVDIISARAIAPLGALAAEKDVDGIDPAYLPYYSHMSGTSMSTPHVAGIVALMLDANPLLSPADVKQILKETATNMPGRESWEVGAGYVNAYEAVNKSFHGEKLYGSTVNSLRYEEGTFNATSELETKSEEFTINYLPVGDNTHPLNIEEGLAQVVVKIDGYGVTSVEEGNPIRLILYDPNGVEYRSSVSLLFSLYTSRIVTVDNPIPGDWTVYLEGLYGVVGSPEDVDVFVTKKIAKGFTGLNDISGHAAEDAIKVAISERLVDGYSDGNYKPNNLLTRNELAEYLVMGAGIRQVEQTSDNAAVDAVTSRGAALKGKHQYHAVMQLDSEGNFNGNKEVTRVELAYSLIQSLGLQKEAESFSGDVTVDFKGERIKVKDEIAEEYKGYVQLALDLGLLSVTYELTQGPYDIMPTLSANFNGGGNVTRAEYAVIMTRYKNSYVQ